MEILNFKLVGKFAHFRKYFSNSTALSYSIPPRTTLMGIVAAVMGYDRDSYYEKLSSENLKIALGVKTNLKKTFHRVNNLKIEAKNWAEFKGARLHTQTPFEIITPLSISEDELIYEIYLHFVDSGLSEFFKKKLLANQSTYNLSLGVAQFSCSIKDVNILMGTLNSAEKEEISFNSAVNSKHVSKLCFKNQSDYDFVEEDLFPADFVANYDRSLNRIVRLLYTFNNIPLIVEFSGEYCVLSNNKIIQFI